MPSIRNSYQEGSIVRTARAKGPDQWVYRWRETQPDGTVLRRSKIIGDLTHYPTKADAKRLVENFRSELNAATPVEKIDSMTVTEAWGHFQANELRDPDSDRSPNDPELPGLLQDAHYPEMGRRATGRGRVRCRRTMAAESEKIFCAILQSGDW